MQLHDHLYALGLQTGRDLFDDPERLRAALASSGAPAGEVELVVDAVRRGAYRAMITALDSGIDPGRAVEETGGRLASERGSDPAEGRWALAVLGFAAGRVGENDVRRARPAGPIGQVPPSQAPTQVGLPTNPRVPPATYQAPPQAPAYAQPQYAQPQYAQPQAYAPQGGWSPTPSTKSRTPLLLGVGGTVAAVVLAVVVALLVAGGGDDPQQASDDGSSSTGPTSESTSEVTSETEPTTEVTSETTEDPDRVSDEAAAGYTAALLTFSSDFGKAGDKLSKATDNDNTPQAKAAGREMRASVYDLDLAVRDLDLTPVQAEVNTFLGESGRMIKGLDKLERTAKSAFDVNIGFLSLPITQYTDSFQTVGDAIDASRADG